MRGVLERLETGPAGRRLWPDLRRKLERALAADLRDVRLHEHDAVLSLGARAIASGDRIWFRRGALDPSSASGLRLLVHELVHVVQQRQGRVASRTGRALIVDEALESEAERIARRIVADPRARVVWRDPGLAAASHGVAQPYVEADLIALGDEEGLTPMQEEDADADVYRAWCRETNNGELVVPIALLCDCITASHMAAAGSGVGTGSCSAVVEYLDTEGGLGWSWGNSYVGQACVHAEAQACAFAYNASDFVSGELITRVYVELSPCTRCHADLPRLAPNATVLYRFEHGKADAMREWRAYKRDRLKEERARLRDLEAHPSYKLERSTLSQLIDLANRDS